MITIHGTKHWPLPNIDSVGPEVFNPDAVPFDKVGMPQAPPFRVHAVGDDGDGSRWFSWTWT